jgi:hypothetical protein
MGTLFETIEVRLDGLWLLSFGCLLAGSGGVVIRGGPTRRMSTVEAVQNTRVHMSVESNRLETNERPPLGFRCIADAIAQRCSLKGSSARLLREWENRDKGSWVSKMGRNRTLCASRLHGIRSVMLRVGRMGSLKKLEFQSVS